MDELLSTVTPAKAYQDDISIGSPDLDQALVDLRGVFDRMREVNLKFTAKKCFLMFDQLELLGHIVGPDGISSDPKKGRCSDGSSNSKVKVRCQVISWIFTVLYAIYS